jgi:hypothetical protein
VVTVTKFIPPRTDVAVQPAGIAGAVTPSKFWVSVAVGIPTMIVRLKLVAPRLLLTLKVRFRAEPHCVPCGTVKLTCWLPLDALLIVP